MNMNVTRGESQDVPRYWIDVDSYQLARWNIVDSTLRGTFGKVGKKYNLNEFFAKRYQVKPFKAIQQYNWEITSTLEGPM